jgi:hypothetical protein
VHFWFELIFRSRPENWRNVFWFWITISKKKK